MAESNKDEEQIHISADAARGGLGTEKVSSGDTLLPMLVGGLALIVIGVIVVLMIV